MKFIISSSVLRKNLQNINGVIATNPLVPILENFLFRIDEPDVNLDINLLIDENEKVKLSEKGITAVILINRLTNYPKLDEIDELILEIYKDHKKIHSTHHYDFERIVRKVFTGMGYLVTPTKRTRDGGYDMIAERRGVIPTCHLIECKTRKKDPIGIELIERFLFKINDLKASTGIFVTNLKFSKDILKKYATETYKNYLKLIDCKEILSMIQNYVLRHLSNTLQTF